VDPSFDHMIYRTADLLPISRTDHELSRSVDDDSVFTTLCEDVYSLVNIQVDVLHEYLLVKKIDKTEIGRKVVLVTMLSLVQNLHQLQLQHRDRFLTGLESSCAAANDFLRMIERFDDLLDAVHRRYPRLRALLMNPVTAMNKEDSAKMALLEQKSSELVALYGNDAVYSVQRSQIYVMKVIQNSTIKHDLFSAAWEDEFVHNEVSLAIVHTLEDFLSDCYEHLSDAFLYGKLVSALMQSTVCFYMQCLVQKADRARLQKRKLAIGWPTDSPFRSPRRAIMRMMYDIEVFRTYFKTMAKQLPGLSKLVDDELSVLVVLHECFISLAENSDASTLEELIMVLHKRTGANVAVTRFMIKDLGLLAAGHRPSLKATLESMEADLHLLSNNLDQSRCEQKQAQQRDHLSGLRLKEVLEQLYEHRIVFEQVRYIGPCMNLVRRAVGDKRWGDHFKTSPVPVPVPVSPRQSTKAPPVIPPVFSEITWVPDGDKKVDSNSSPIQSTETPPVVTPPRYRDILWVPDSAKAEKTVVFPNFNFTDGPAEPPTKITRALSFSQEDHERTVKALQAKLFAILKLHNLKFVAKHSSIDFEKRLAEVNERVW
jgi:hypothetical protein